MLLDSATPANGRASPRQARAWQLISGALCQRAWVQAVILVAVLVIVAAQLVRWAEVDNEQAEALEYLDMIRALHRLENLGSLNRTTLLTLRKFSERAAAAPLFEDRIWADASAAENLWASSGSSPLPQNWSLVGSIWFIVTVFTTIGYGTYTPQTPVGQLIVVVFATFGIPTFGYLALLAGSALNDWALKLQFWRSDKDGLQGVFEHTGSPLHPPRVSFSNNDGGSASDGWRSRRQQLGIAVILLAVLFSGALLCHLTEVQQLSAEQTRAAVDDSALSSAASSVLASCYFCFISMTTVGFGDQHPSISSPLKLAVFALWLSVSVTVSSAVVANTINRMSTAHEELLKALCHSANLDYDEALKTMRSFPFSSWPDDMGSDSPRQWAIELVARVSASSGDDNDFNKRIDDSRRFQSKQAQAPARTSGSH